MQAPGVDLAGAGVVNFHVLCLTGSSQRGCPRRLHDELFVLQIIDMEFAGPSSFDALQVRDRDANDDAFARVVAFLRSQIEHTVADVALDQWQDVVVPLDRKAYGLLAGHFEFKGAFAINRLERRHLSLLSLSVARTVYACSPVVAAGDHRQRQDEKRNERGLLHFLSPCHLRRYISNGFPLQNSKETKFFPPGL